MKKLFTFFVAVATTAAAFAEKPILVGHRGSLYGVENSVESFTNGAKLGYEFLETDFKVTKDKQLVCSHDDDISRLSSDGSTLSIASSTLEELQSHPFAQTRSGVKYTGRLCSAQEYLDVCKEYNVRPLIELKWATGINSNDCSNIPMLIDFIEKNGFRDKCIILTSMKPCLEYIRTNYPDVELQFLTGEYWANHFDWCVQWKIDADIQAGYFDKATVTKYHDKGLKVNMWTTNTNDGYKQYGNWGCDFITTDYLDPKDLPELDPNVTFPPNTVDYPNSEGSVRGNYDSEKITEVETPSTLAGRNIKKALFRDGEWIVLSFGAANSDARIDCIDPETGNVTGQYSTEGIENIGDIAISADGILIASTEGVIPFNVPEEPTAFFRLYKWDSKTSLPQEFFNTATAEEMGNWINSYCGAHIAASGRFDSLKVYVSSWSASGTTTRMVGLQFDKGNMIKNAYDLEGKWGTDYSITVSPTSRDCFIIDSADIDPTEYTFIWGDRATLEVNSSFPTGAMSTSAQGMSFFRRASKVYGVFPTAADNGSLFTAAVYDVTDGMEVATPVTAKLHEGLGSEASSFAATAMTSGADGHMYVHFLTTNGLASFVLPTEEQDGEPQDVDLALNLDWIYSVSTGNDPAEYIDGTNAQMGTAVNGLFYINDCSKKQLFILDENGYVGAVPGGAGWGCARDDAGNIVIRDDKLTGNTHSFIIYPAGTTPSNFDGAVKFDADVVYSGQTNFINAGGDLLKGTGHIYLYPNGQTAVNIITVTEGVVTASKGYVDLSMAGTTAGYVIPQNDDTENWLYQIRGTGIYRYNGGASTAISTSRAGTTPPARNSTTGAAYFKLLGNQILIHNSGINYCGGFTVKNMSDNEKVIATIAPIGDKGYSAGGNYSVSNWIIPEKVSDGTYNIYQYCPANGIAKYTLVDNNSAVNDVLVADDDSSITVYADHNTLSVNGVHVSKLRIYNVSGVLVASSDCDIANISALAPGVYIVTVNGDISRKFVKK